MLSTVFVVIFGLILGLAFTFYGLRVFLVMLPVWGFFAGFWLGAQAVSLVMGGAYLISLSSLAVAMAVGILFAILSYRYFEVGVVLVTAVFGMALATGVMQAVGLESGVLVPLGAVAVAILLAWLLFRFDLDRYLIVVITALGGASLLVATALILFGRISLDQVINAGNAVGPILRDSWLWLLLWLGLAALGIFIQFRANSDFDWRKNDLVQGWS